MIATSDIINFNLPNHLACPKPTELRNISRDDVRLLVTSDNGVEEHTYFRNFTDYLKAGDVLVVNTSATQLAAFPIVLPNGKKGRIHFSTQMNNTEWLAEIRVIKGNKTVRWQAGEVNMVFELAAGLTIQLKSNFYESRTMLNLWRVEIKTVRDFQSYRNEYGQPIRYENLDKPYPLDYFQTFFSFHAGSSEMPSAGRGFTPELIDKLLQKGVVFAPILLHTGVSSLEENESPYPEYFEVNPITAAILNHAKSNDNRIISVGTTAIRAVESATNEVGKVISQKGHTNLYIKSDYQMKTVNSLLTGFHEPKASHLHMLQALAGVRHIARAYTAAIDHAYYWHQFGDLHLILNKC
ncbi:MAG: S-adenosylmethionine:tRNA ribosyltransferase-isomerase [Saprospiraceae bacterium]